MNYTTIEEQLEKDGKILELSVGVSMWPMLRQRKDQIVISKLENTPKINDVVLFKRQNGQYVLHRIVKYKNNVFLIRGDNCYSNEKVYPSQIIGILQGFYRNDKYIDCDNKKYGIYVSFWRTIYPVRYIAYKTFTFLRGLIKRR